MNRRMVTNQTIILLINMHVLREVEPLEVGFFWTVSDYHFCFNAFYLNILSYFLGFPLAAIQEKKNLFAPFAFWFD